ncbi:MAG: hypothetical protein QXK24_08900 [Ignisphaera sp.]
MEVPRLYIKKMIRHYGQTVPIKKRKVLIDEQGNAFYVYEQDEPVRGHFNQITPTDEAIQRWGRYIECDCIGTFLPDTNIEEGDQLFINGAWYEVVNKVVRSTKGKADFIEVLLRRRG